MKERLVQKKKTYDELQGKPTDKTPEEESKVGEETEKEEDKKKEIRQNNFTQIAIPRVYSNNNYGRLTPQKVSRPRNILYLKNELNKSFDNDHSNLIISK